MNDPVWLGNYIVSRWVAFLLVGSTAIVALIACAVFITFIYALVSWLVNPTAKPGKQ